VAESDPEIAALRADPRGAALLERMRRHSERVRAFAAEPAVHVAAARGTGPPPLLVVLHADGRTKDDVVRGPWRALADELGAVLLAPSGSITSGAEPEQGLDWFEHARDLLRQPSCEKSVLAAVRAFAADHDFDGERVWIAGAGQGALVAFDVALRYPGLFRGVVLSDGVPHPETPPARARAGAALGLRVVLAADPAEPARLAPIEGWLGDLGFDVRVVSEMEPGTALQAEMTRR
jgi:predicted esterase